MAAIVPCCLAERSSAADKSLRNLTCSILWTCHCCVPPGFAVAASDSRRPLGPSAAARSAPTWLRFADSSFESRSFSLSESGCFPCRHPGHDDPNAQVPALTMLNVGSQPAGIGVAAAQPASSTLWFGCLRGYRFVCANVWSNISARVRIKVSTTFCVGVPAATAVIPDAGPRSLNSGRKPAPQARSQLGHLLPGRPRSLPWLGGRSIRRCHRCSSCGVFSVDGCAITRRR